MNDTLLVWILIIEIFLAAGLLILSVAFSQPPSHAPPANQPAKLIQAAHGAVIRPVFFSASFLRVARCCKCRSATLRHAISHTLTPSILAPLRDQPNNPSKREWNPSFPSPAEEFRRGRRLGA